MKIFLKKHIPKILALFILLAPTLLLAQTPHTVDNPLKSTDLTVILKDIMDLVATAGAIVVVFFIIYSGFKFVTAGDSDSDRTKAKEMFYATIIGGAILLGADVIAKVVVNTVETTTGFKF